MMRSLLTVLTVLGGLFALAGQTPLAQGRDLRAPFEPDLKEEVLEAAAALASSPMYQLDWTLLATGADDASLPGELLGRMEVRVVNLSPRPWAELWFHLLPNLIGGELTVAEVRVDGAEVEPLLVDGGRLLRLELAAPLTPGEAAVVSLGYRLEIPVSSRRNYGILGRQGGMLSLAHAYPMLAVHGEGGWDLDRPPPYGDLVHARSSFFTASIDAPAGLDLAFSGRLIERAFEGARQRLRVAAGPVRDFYVAGGIGLDIIEERVGDAVVRGHAPPGAEEGMALAVAHAASALEIFERRFGPYPYRELDVVAISTSALGVEFPGIIAIRRSLLSPAEGERWLESTVVHEMAHQWFYSLVGNDQVSEPWLDESLTQYLTLRYFLERHGVDGYRRFRQGLFARWDEVDRRKIPIGLPVASYSQREYGAIVYGLGPLVIEWLAGSLERPRFDRFLQDYVERHAFGLAGSEDFLRLAEERCACDLDDFFDEWIRPLPLD
jgi:aminopeptidase N